MLWSSEQPPLSHHLSTWFVHAPFALISKTTVKNYNFAKKREGYEILDAQKVLMQSSKAELFIPKTNNVCLVMESELACRTLTQFAFGEERVTRTTAAVAVKFFFESMIGK